MDFLHVILWIIFSLHEGFSLPQFPWSFFPLLFCFCHSLLTCLSDFFFPYPISLPLPEISGSQVPIWQCCVYLLPVCVIANISATFTYTTPICYIIFLDKIFHIKEKHAKECEKCLTHCVCGCAKSCPALCHLTDCSLPGS